MKNSTNSNMYARTAEETWARFEGRLSDSPLALFCVISGKELGETAKRALASSAERLGYGNAAAFAMVGSMTASEQALGEDEVFALVEGLDPVALVAADAEAARALSSAFRADVAPGRISRVAGRSCAAFRSFEEMLKAPEAKQKAWALLKQLPRFGE